MVGMSVGEHDRLDVADVRSEGCERLRELVVPLGKTGVDHRELATVLPLIVLVFWIGLNPKPVLNVMTASVDHLVEQVNSVKPLQFSEVFGGR